MPEFLLLFALIIPQLVAGGYAKSMAKVFGFGFLYRS